MSDATTPANPTGQIATVAATPAVAPDAQQDIWREDYYRVENVVSHDQAVDEADCPRCSLHRLYELTERLEAERDALLAEHEAQSAYNLAFTTPGTDGEEIDRRACAVFDAHDNAERVIRGE